MSPPSGPAKACPDIGFSQVHPWSASAVASTVGLAAGRDEPDDGGSQSTVTESQYFRTKPVLDRAAAVVLAIVALPAMAAIAVAVLLCDGRPVFYRQSRVGKHNRPFLIWKFRTMRREAERQTGPVWSSAADDRVTRLGRWLRLSHVDELPQILNVLSGEMSLIGPRPERPEFVSQLALELPRYTQRLQVRPGITGLAQLTLGYDRCVADVRHKVELDLQYIRTATLAGDLSLLLRTLPCVLHEVWRHRRAGRLHLETQVDTPQVETQQMRSHSVGIPVLHGQPRPAPLEHAADSLPIRVVPRRRTA